MRVRTLTFALVTSIFLISGCKSGQQTEDVSNLIDAASVDAFPDVFIDQAEDIYQQDSSLLDALTLDIIQPDSGIPVSEWAISAGGMDKDWGNAIAVDASGNVYVTGYFDGQAKFGGAILWGSGWDDIFVAKYDNQGNISWARSEGASGEDWGNSIAVDVSGNVYVTGYFNNQVIFGSTTFSAANQDIFVTKYDSAGTLLWARSAGSSYKDRGESIAVDTSGNAYVTGSFFVQAVFGTETISGQGGVSHAFVTKYDSAGTVLWAKAVSEMGKSWGNGITVDANGNIYMAGGFEDQILFGSTTLTSSGWSDMFVAKYDNVQTSVWARSAGGKDYDSAEGVAIDSSGNLYITGGFQDQAVFRNTTLTSLGWSDMFAAKYDNAGTLLWLQSAGGTGNDLGYNIAADKNGTSYVTGVFEGQAIFGNKTLLATGSADVFAVKYTSSGSIVWARPGGGSKEDHGKGVTVDTFGNTYVTGGYFSQYAIFGATNLTSTTGSTESDVFVWKIGAL